MPFVFHRRLTIPLWGAALFAVVLTAPTPERLRLMAALGIAAIAFTGSGLVSRWRSSRSGVDVLSGRRWHRPGAVTSVAAAARMRTLDEPNRITAEGALDLVRMDDDGGWQVTQPPPAVLRAPSLHTLGVDS